MHVKQLVVGSSPIASTINNGGRSSVGRAAYILIANKKINMA